MIYLLNVAEFEFQTFVQHAITSELDGQMPLEIKDLLYNALEMIDVGRLRDGADWDTAHRTLILFYR